MLHHVVDFPAVVRLDVQPRRPRSRRQEESPFKGPQTPLGLVAGSRPGTDIRVQLLGLAVHQRQQRASLRRRQLRLKYVGQRCREIRRLRQRRHAPPRLVRARQAQDERQVRRFLVGVRAGRADVAVFSQRQPAVGGQNHQRLAVGVHRCPIALAAGRFLRPTTSRRRRSCPATAKTVRRRPHPRGRAPGRSTALTAPVLLPRRRSIPPGSTAPGTPPASPTVGLAQPGPPTIAASPPAASRSRAAEADFSAASSEAVRITSSQPASKPGSADRLSSMIRQVWTPRFRSCSIRSAPSEAGGSGCEGSGR